jgi:hypothetical protein
MTIRDMTHMTCVYVRDTTHMTCVHVRDMTHVTCVYIRDMILALDYAVKSKQQQQRCIF